ncbi:MAG: ribosome biogenesis GTPase YlqF [Oscillospiraceae bacterium]|jgi:ribosome biogenesis GTPase A|nr:ribosome biogenesis GTPase YlqF [Oscillospiraceae bacterium]
MSGVNDNFDIHWFPGHMAKTRRIIEENLRLTDILAEITDARIPESGRNPLLSEVAGDKPRVLLLNKRDYADDDTTRLWIECYSRNGIPAVSCDCRSGAGLSGFVPFLKRVSSRLNRKYSGALRVMVAGIPNAGKSSLINRLAGGKRAAVGDRPGVTRGKQWISAGKEIELLDLPGILPPKLDNRETALKLAYVGAVKDEVMDTESLAASLAAYLCANRPEKLMERYKLRSLDGDVMESIAKSRGMTLPGGIPDAKRAALNLLDEFRSGKIGKISLEKPHEFV